jgi:hypothetical protein
MLSGVEDEATRCLRCSIHEINIVSTVYLVLCRVVVSTQFTV